MSTYVCSNCGAEAYYDGRCGDGPVLMCACTKRSRWVNDGRGGYTEYANDARPVESDNYSGDSWEWAYWSNDRR